MTKLNYKSVREKSIELSSLLPLDQIGLQVTPEVSPIKWHLGHTSWFFEYFILQEFSDYKIFNKDYFKVFNSYYKGAGEHIEQSKRGELVPYTLSEILTYRKIIDEGVLQYIDSFTSKQKLLLKIGLEHEKQHQELILMDVLRTSFEYGTSFDQENIVKFRKSKLIMNEYAGGLFEVGRNLSSEEFSYDNETPKHKTYIAPFKFASRLVTNEEYQEFIDEGGYEDPNLWLSDGWKWLNENEIKLPLYWKDDYEFSLHGYQKRDPHSPVRHICYYEAQAYARFKNKRLPTENEWEYVASKQQDSLKSIKQSLYLTCAKANSEEINDLFGSLWQWTQSAYLPYPGYKWDKDILGEYNGKFMINQMVLRGGAYATPDEHLRITYRNFFYPYQRWAFTGIRLAEDL